MILWRFIIDNQLEKTGLYINQVHLISIKSWYQSEFPRLCNIFWVIWRKKPIKPFSSTQYSKYDEMSIKHQVTRSHTKMKQLSNAFRYSLVFYLMLSSNSNWYELEMIYVTNRFVNTFAINLLLKFGFISLVSFYIDDMKFTI